MQFTVEWKEKVFDCNGDPECINDKPSFTVQADTIDEAKEKAISKCRDLIAESRPDQSKGYFISWIVCLVDEGGIRHKC